MPRKIRIIPIALDLSGSMDEEEPGTGRKKKEIAAEHIVKGICGTVTDSKNWSEVKSKAHRTYVGISVFGVEGASDLVVMEPMSLLEIRELAKDGRCSEIERMVLDAVSDMEGDGTSAAQFVDGVMGVINAAISKAAGERGVEPRILVLLYSDACFNIFRGNASDKYEGTMQAKKDLVSRVNQVVQTLPTQPSKPQSVIRGVIALLYGDESRIESDDGICPKRAALIASRRDELPEAVRRELERLFNDGILELGEDMGDMAVDNSTRVADYAVAKVRRPADLAVAVTTITTTVSSRSG